MEFKRLDIMPLPGVLVWVCNKDDQRYIITFDAFAPGLLYSVTCQGPNGIIRKLGKYPTLNAAKQSIKLRFG